MPEPLPKDMLTGDLTVQKQELLLAFHRVGWEEMTWRRNAGYRTVILGLAYCGILPAVSKPINRKVDCP